MNNYCAFSKGHQCLKWTDYEITRYQLEEADELYHGNWIEIESLQKRVDFLKAILEKNGIPIPDGEDSF